MIRDTFFPQIAAWGADEFRASSVRIYDEHMREWDEVSFRRIGRLIAGATNQAFALELYIKALSYFSAPKLAHGHKLHELLVGLDHDAQQNIEVEYDRLKAADPEMLKQGVEFFINRADEQPSQPPQWTSDEYALAAVLQRCSTAFNEWRYVHERGAQSGGLSMKWEYGPLNLVCIAVRAECNRALLTRGVEGLD